jgi:hypothetical protein
MKSEKALKALAHETAVAFCNSKIGVTKLLRACKTKPEVIYSVDSLLSDIAPTLKELESSHLLDTTLSEVKNNIVQFFARCRNGNDKLPPVWFESGMSMSFEPVAFTVAEKRKVNKKGNDDAKALEIIKLADERVKAILDDKVELTKLQGQKLSRVVAESDKKVSRVVAESGKLAKQLASEKALSSDNARKVTELKKQLATLADENARHKRQIQALVKALRLAQIEQTAIDLILKQA